MIGPLPSVGVKHAIEVTVENRGDGTIAVQAYDTARHQKVRHTFGRRIDQLSEQEQQELATQREVIRNTPINDIM